MTPRSSTGGAASAGGVGFEARIAAWLAAHAVAGRTLALGLPGGSLITAIGGQTGLGMDDMGALLANGGRVLIQAKKGLSGSASLRSAIGQAVAAFCAGFEEAAGTSRPLDPRRDLLAIVTDPSAPATMRVDLSTVTLRLTALPEELPFEHAARNSREKHALDELLGQVESEWEDLNGQAPTEQEVRALLQMLRVLVLDLGDNGPDRSSAELLLGTALADPSTARTAFERLCHLGLHLAERQMWYPVDRLYAYLAPQAAPEREPWIGQYFKALRDSSITHSYPAPVGRSSPPPLMDLFVTQQVRLKSGSSTSPFKVALSVLDHDAPITVLIAGPGGGKSTLLQRRLLMASERWWDRAAETDAGVPVLLRAGTLTEEKILPRLLADATDRTFSHVLRTSPTEEAFGKPPYPDGVWLVMVDGIDEIADRSVRVKVLERIARFSASWPDRYRFVVTTRPLPGVELNSLGADTAHFELQAFSAENLRDYAAAWFGSDELAGRFIASLRGTRLEVLARTPLVSFMLCQIYAANPGARLPEGRSQIYEAFVDLIWESNSHKRVREIHDQAIAALLEPMQDSGARRDAEAAAQHARNCLQDLVGFLALARLLGDKRPTAEVMAAHVEIPRPDRVKTHAWDAFLGELLHSTGLVAHSDETDDYEFLHQTLIEYLAARHEQDPAEVARAQLRVYAEPAASRPKSALFDRSYLAFLIDVTPNRLADDLSPFARGDFGHGGDFIVSLAIMGTDLSSATINSTCAALDRRARDNGVAAMARVQAASGLHDLGDRRGLELLNELANDHRVVGKARFAAARHLRDVSDPRGLQFLRSLSRDVALDIPTRIRSFAALGQAADQESADVLNSVAGDLHETETIRLQADNVLLQMGDTRSRARLNIMLADDNLSKRRRAQVVRLLAAAGILDDVNVFGGMVDDTRLDESTRLWAIGMLERIGGQQAFSRLYELARRHTAWYSAEERRVEEVVRKHAIKALGACSSPLVNRYLLALMEDRDVPKPRQHQAATLLRQRVALRQASSTRVV
ncbi:NACHT domain-containing protein [Streptomyces sp. NPDC057543]|uniref:NACHT domain-containing protein n=1 Tax=Streptomyces sp. NPDC057543 TaxID=3346163 RepID=UPI00369F4283